MVKIILVAGARPNFMKIAPIYREFTRVLNMKPKLQLVYKISHTGQHYDNNMSEVFIKELELPKPDFYLGVGSGTHAEQTARIMIKFEKVLLREKPDLVIVVGDVNSTVACSLTAVKLGIKVAHVEAGLRSFDRSMPEEINRILTDAISDFLFVSEPSGVRNLKNEGISEEKIFFVGNVMIDSLVAYLPKIEKSKILQTLSIEPFSYCVVTLHRPSNVDEKNRLKEIVEMLINISYHKKLIFPVHPRTRYNLEKYDLIKYMNHNIIITEPLGYIDFISLLKTSAFVLTDSGGIQEETTFLGVPCVTLRNSTERPITVEVGTNYLVGEDINQAYKYVNEIIDGNFKKGKIPELWDGKASKRIVNILIKYFLG